MSGGRSQRGSGSSVARIVVLWVGIACAVAMWWGVALVLDLATDARVVGALGAAWMAAVIWEAPDPRKVYDKHLKGQEPSWWPSILVGIIAPVAIWLVGAEVVGLSGPARVAGLAFTSVSYLWGLGAIALLCGCTGAAGVRREELRATVGAVLEATPGFGDDLQVVHEVVAGRVRWLGVQTAALVVALGVVWFIDHPVRGLLVVVLGGAAGWRAFHLWAWIGNWRATAVPGDEIRPEVFEGIVRLVDESDPDAAQAAHRCATQLRRALDQAK
ncbi:MAG: hypothetical protein ACLFRV_10890 [Acidimicrobiales bacterium]